MQEGCPWCWGCGFVVMLFSGWRCLVSFPGLPLLLAQQPSAPACPKLLFHVPVPHFLQEFPPLVASSLLSCMATSSLALGALLERCLLVCSWELAQAPCCALHPALLLLFVLLGAVVTSPARYPQLIILPWLRPVGGRGCSGRGSDEAALPQVKVTEECSQYEFENYMRQQLLLAEEKNTLHEAKSFLQKRQFGNIPPVRRLGHDAQPMNPLDAAILAQRYLRK